MTDQATPAKVRLTDGLGPLVDAEMAAYYEGEYGDHSTARARLLDFARVVIAAECVAAREAVAAERERIRATLLEWHERDKHRHNYWAFVARELFGDKP